MILNDINGKKIDISFSDKKLFEKFVRYGRVKSGIELYYKKNIDVYYFSYWNSDNNIKDELESISEAEATEFLKNKSLKLNPKRKHVLLLD